ncbi:branched-chain amino acid ABC transporter permease, partial [Amycolatopsis thermoflava]|uniref:branched-chain amino acid ABC transporter permease n=1 Tax=Amycolatopsis thermoflava TaxID=84480 RepID=UPI003663462F
MALLLAIGTTSSTGYAFGLASTLCIDIVALVGLNIIAGHAGQLALGHAGLIGAGAYVVAILGTDYGTSPLTALVLAPVLSAILAVVIGFPTLRLRGLYFAVATLAFAVIVDFVINRAVTLTGGPDGKTVVPLTVGARSYASSEDFFYLAVIVVLVVLVLDRLFVRTWMAWGLKAAKMSEAAVAGVGVPVYATRLGAFAMAGALAGLAGAMLAYQTAYVSPSTFTLAHSIDLFVVLFIGGMATFVGPVAGALILYLFDRFLAPYPELSPFVLGIAFLLALRFLPGGLGGALSKAWTSARAKRSRGGGGVPMGLSSGSGRRGWV